MPGRCFPNAQSGLRLQSMCLGWKEDWGWRSRVAVSQSPNLRQVVTVGRWNRAELMGRSRAGSSSRHAAGVLVADAAFPLLNDGLKQPSGPGLYFFAAGGTWTQVPLPCINPSCRCEIGAISLAASIRDLEITRCRWCSSHSHESTQCKPTQEARRYMAGLVRSQASLARRSGAIFQTSVFILLNGGGIGREDPLWFRNLLRSRPLRSRPVRRPALPRPEAGSHDTVRNPERTTNITTSAPAHGSVTLQIPRPLFTKAVFRYPLGRFSRDAVGYSPVFARTGRHRGPLSSLRTR